jgi:hypothetical protein
MHKIIASTALALALAAPSLPFSFSAASAQDIELHLDRNGPSVQFMDDCDPDREDCRGRDRRDRRDDYRESRRHDRGCTPDRALDKAERMGSRRARIADVGRRTIDGGGRSRHGNRVIVTFDRRDRRCGVVG